MTDSTWTMQDRHAARRESIRLHESAYEIWGHTLIVDKALARDGRDPLTASQVVEVLRTMHDAGHDDDQLADTVRSLVGDDVHCTAAVCRTADHTHACTATQAALEAVVASPDRGAAATAEQHARAAGLLALAAVQHDDREQHVTELAGMAMFMTGQFAPIAGNSLALAATLTTGSTYMLLADAVELLMEQRW